MKIKKLFLLLAVLPTLLFADDYCCDSNADSQCCGWFDDSSLYIDWLYWRPRRSNLDYAIPYDENVQSIGSVLNVEPEYKSGFRIGLQKSCDCIDYELRYTYFRPTFLNSLNDPSGLYAATRLLDLEASVDVGNLQIAQAKWKLDYDQIDLIVARPLCTSSCIQSRVFGGFTWARIDQSYRVDYFDGTTFELVNESIDMDGYGLNLGIDARCPWRCFNLFGAVWYNVLIANFEGDWKYVNSGNFVGDLNNDVWEMISVMNLNFGIEYCRACSVNCLDFWGVSIGYEFHHWINMPDFLAINGADEQIVLDHRTNFSFDGLFIRLALGF